jgi:recombinational DNA repair ATPase RecF
MKIKNLHVQAQGPLSQELVIKPKGLNLIFGQNETGKTFLLESMAHWLFGKGKNSPLKKVGRKWDPVPVGSVEVSGVHGDLDLSLDSSSKKNLQDYLVDELGMPADLSELLLVRAGETLLGNPDDLVKRSLSASGMLQEIIDEKVSRTLQNASIEGGVIRGNNTGEIKKRRDWKDRLSSLLELRDRYAQEEGTKLDGLKDEINKLEAEIGKLHEAKRFKAYQISQEEKVLLEKLDKQPKDLDELAEKIDQIEKVRSDLSVKNTRIDSLSKELKHKDWADHAYARFRELEASRKPSAETKYRTNPLFLALCILSFLGAAALFSTTVYWAASVSGLFSVVFLLLWLLAKKEYKAQHPEEDPNLNKIRVEFKEKFGDQLVSEAFFQNKVENLILLQGQKEESLRDLAELRNKEIELNARLETRLGDHSKEKGIEEWKTQVSAWKTHLSELEQAVQVKRSELDRLGILDIEHQPKNPGVDWDVSHFQELRNDLEILVKRSHQSQIDQGELKTEIAAVTQINSVYWEELMSGLEAKIAEAEKEYKKVTAEILGKIAVVSTVHDLQQKEDEMIEQNLQNAEFIASIQAISAGRVKGFTWEGGELKLVQDGIVNLSREFLATGAKEQLMISLRIHFARHYLREKPCFLLLDDAFQHSDWERRGRLVDQIIRLVQDCGWQVFYFTMDNHLRDVFREKAMTHIPDNFMFHELGTLKS